FIGALNTASSNLQLYDMDGITYPDVGCNASLVSQSGNTSLIGNSDDTYFDIGCNTPLVSNSGGAYDDSIFSNGYDIDRLFEIESFSNVDNDTYLNNKYLAEGANEYDEHEDQENELA
ncbi:18927_t:CDS:1, partial [Racocetra fulgida]